MEAEDAECCISAGLLDLCTTLGIGSTLACAVGPTGLRGLQVAAQDLGRAVGMLLQELQGQHLGSICVCGGTDAEGLRELRSVESLDVKTGTWQALPSMQKPRSGASAAWLDGQLIVCGGRNGPEFLSCVESFDTLSKAWSQGPTMHRRRTEATAITLGGKLYVCGGHNGVHDLSEVEVLDPHSAASAIYSWQASPPMLSGRQAAAAAVLKGCLVICGGGASTESKQLVECFCPASASWEELPKMLEGRKGAVAASVKGKLYVCGGTGLVDGDRQVRDTMERFDPVMREWEAFPTMMLPRSHAAAAAFGGTIYVFGGTSTARRTLPIGRGGRRGGRGRGSNRGSITSGGEGLQSVTCLDPALGRWGSWQVCPQMLEPRSYPAAAVVPA